MFSVETARLLLRPFTLDDADAYYEAVFCDPDVMRYLPGGEPRPRERVEGTIRWDVDHWEQHGFGLWAVIHKADNKLIGHCGLQVIPDSTEVEVAYALAKSYWGGGLASEGAHASLRFGFEELGLDRIVAVAVAENTASRRVMGKIGMIYEKIAQVYGTELPYYAISREQFQPGDAVYKVIR